MKFEFLNELLKENITSPHGRELASGDDSQYGEPGYFSGHVMGMEVQVEYNKDSEIIEVDFHSKNPYSNDLRETLTQFVYNGGIGYTEFNPNFREGMLGISYNEAPTHGDVDISDFESTKQYLKEYTDTTKRLWEQFTSMDTMSLGVALVDGYDENIVFLVPMEEQGNTVICDVYFHAMWEESSPFLDMVLSIDAKNVIDVNLRQSGNNSLGEIVPRNIYNSSEILF